MPHRSSSLNSHRKLVRWALVGLLALVLWPVASHAQDRTTRRAGLLIGLGGGADNDPDFGFDNLSWQGLFTMEIDNKTLWGVRGGQIELDADRGLGGTLSYLNVSGEYVFPESFYTSGVFLGLGLYDFAGDGPLADDSGLGIGIGISGDFRLNERFSLLVELSGHYADVDPVDFFLLGHVGVAYHF